MATVYHLPPRRGNVPSSPPTATSLGKAPGAEWRELTRRLVLAKASRGELPPALLEYLLDAAGVAP